MYAWPSMATPALTHRSRPSSSTGPRPLGCSAAFVAIASPNRDSVVISLLTALVCSLAAAALCVKWAAWAAIPIASALVVAGGAHPHQALVRAGRRCDCSCDRRFGGSGVPYCPGRAAAGFGGARDSADRARALTVVGAVLRTDTDDACRLGWHSLPERCGGIPLACRSLHRLRCAIGSRRHRSGSCHGVGVSSNWTRSGLVVGQVPGPSWVTAVRDLLTTS